jgi:hypothetical protein
MNCMATKTKRELEKENGLLVEALEELYDRISSALSLTDEEDPDEEQEEQEADDEE